MKVFAAILIAFSMVTPVAATVIPQTPTGEGFVPLPEPGDRHCPSRSQCPGGGSK